MDQKVSFFTNLVETKPKAELSILEVARLIQIGVYKNQIDKLRTYKESKIKLFELGAITTSGTFNERKSHKIIQHSGLIQVDLDKVDQLKKTRQKLLDDPYTFICFTSPGGLGLKLIVKINPSQETHVSQFRALEKYYVESYKLTIDPACKDLSRAMLLSFDPEIFIQEKAEVFELLDEPQKINKPSILKEPGNPNYKRKGTKESTINHVERIISEIEEKEIDITSNYLDWIKVGFSLISEFGEGARSYYHQVSYHYPGYSQDETDKEFDSLIKEYQPGMISIGSFIYLAHENNIE